MAKPAPRALETLACIERLTAKRGYAPTAADIANAMGVRLTKTVILRVKRLVASGRVERIPETRGLRAVTSSPVVGTPGSQTHNKLPAAGEILT